MKKTLAILLFMLSLIIMDNVFSQTIWRSDLNLTNCFLQPNGDVHCYDAETGRKIILKRI